jgi:hypothetical protein
MDEMGREIGSTRSDVDGQFLIAGVPAGVYQVATSNAAVPCRCWAEGTAPPAAVERLLLVEEETIVRGQRPFRELIFSPPVILATLIIAAIAIPVAIHNSQDDDAS